MTSEGHGEARRLTPEGGARFAAPGICSPNCASHRGFGTFEGIYAEISVLADDSWGFAPKRRQWISLIVAG